MDEKKKKRFALISYPQNITLEFLVKTRVSNEWLPIQSGYDVLQNWNKKKREREREKVLHHKH